MEPDGSGKGGAARVVLYEEDVLSWISEYLYSTGLVATAKTLEEETPLTAESIPPAFTEEMQKFRALVLNGQWAKLLRFIDLLESHMEDEMQAHCRFLLRRIQLVELLMLASSPPHATVGASDFLLYLKPRRGSVQTPLGKHDPLFLQQHPPADGGSSVSMDNIQVHLVDVLAGLKKVATEEQFHALCGLLRMMPLAQHPAFKDWSVTKERSHVFHELASVLGPMFGIDYAPSHSEASKSILSTLLGLAVATVSLQPSSPRNGACIPPVTIASSSSAPHASNSTAAMKPSQLTAALEESAKTFHAPELQETQQTHVPKSSQGLQTRKAHSAASKDRRSNAASSSKSKHNHKHKHQDVHKTKGKRKVDTHAHKAERPRSSTIEQENGSAHHENIFSQRLHEHESMFSSSMEPEAALHQTPKHAVVPQSPPPGPVTSTPSRKHAKRAERQRDFGSRKDEAGNAELAQEAPQQLKKRLTFEAQESSASEHLHKDPASDVDSIHSEHRDPCPAQFQRQLVGLVEDQMAVRCVAFHPQGNYVAIGSNTQTLRICSTHILQQRPQAQVDASAVSHLPIMHQKKKIHKGSIYSVNWNSSGNLLVTSSNDKTAHISSFVIDTCEVEKAWSLRPHNGTIRTTLFSSESLFFTAGGGDCNVALHDADKLTQDIVTFSGHKNQVCALSYADGLLISGSMDSTVKFWDSRQGTCVRSVGFDGVSVNSCALTSDGQRFAAGLEDGTVAVFDTRHSKVLMEEQVHESDCRCITSIMGDRYFLSSSYDGTARVIALPGDEQEFLPYTSGIVAKHMDKVIQSTVHPELPVIATTSADHTTKFWYVWC